MPHPGERPEEPVRAATPVGSLREPLADRAGPARTAICVRDLALHHEVLDFLGRDSRIEVVAASTDTLPDGPENAAGLDATVVCAPTAETLRGRPSREGQPEIVVVAEEMTVPVLRAAIGAGAAAVCSWPAERAELAEAVGRSRGTRHRVAPPRGRVIAVFGARGGVGTTFVATHLAAALVDGGASAVLVDMDVSFSQVTAALGFAPDEAAHTVADLVDVADELSPEHVERALTAHPRGFAVLLAPDERALTSARADDADPAPGVETARFAGLYSGSIALLAGQFDAVVLHVPRTLDRLSRAAIRLSDRVVLVSSLDLLSLYGTRRALHALQLAGPEQADRCLLVLNRAQRGAARGADAERVLGLKPGAILPLDPAVGRFQDRGELVPAGGRRAAAAIRRLASLVGPSADPSSAEGPAVGGRKRR